MREERKKREGDRTSEDVNGCPEDGYGVEAAGKGGRRIGDWLARVYRCLYTSRRKLRLVTSQEGWVLHVSEVNSSSSLQQVLS